MFGAFAQTEVVQTLLDGGFAVLTPAAPEKFRQFMIFFLFLCVVLNLDCSLFWETNIPPWDISWNSSSDHAFMLEIINHIHNQTIFGPLDAGHLFATGISSGGYMTSRMAVSMTKYFRAVVIASGSYMICGGPACEVPGALHCIEVWVMFLWQCW